MTLHTKYRPIVFGDVIGHRAVVKSLAEVIANRDSQAFLFCGPSGVGKTTLARIAAQEMGTADKDILEIDAATRTGIDAMRAVQDMMQYRPFGEAGNRSVIIDEAHGLSRSAWQSLLKIVEEPPPFVSWFFCTTEPGKVPATVKTRCASYTLNLVPDNELGVLFDEVCELEKIKLPGDVGDMIIQQAMGSPRQLLVNLAMCRDVSDRKTAAILLRKALESDSTIELCRFLLKGGSWTKAMVLVKELEEENPESIRIVVCNYLASCLRNSKGSDKEVCFLLGLLEAFAEPYNASEQTAPLIRSIGRALFGS